MSPELQRKPAERERAAPAGDDRRDRRAVGRPGLVGVVRQRYDTRVFAGGRWSFRDDNTELHTLHHLGGGNFAWPAKSVQAKVLPAR